MTVRDTRFVELVDHYEVFLFDAYGVLVHGTGIMPGATSAIALLAGRGKPYYVVTNDASRLPETAAARYRHMGLDLDAGRIITSGMLLADHFRNFGLTGARCAVLGPSDGIRYVQIAGGEVVPVTASFDVLVICDESGFPFLEMVDATLTSLIRILDSGRSVHLVVPNPDIIYPEGTQAFGFAAGSVALMFEAALARRYPDRPDLRFARLGKPEPELYRHAVALAGAGPAVMIGDQLETDIAGANRAGIDSALLTTGVSLGQLADIDPASRPTYRIPSLSP